jgi:crotonobetainyl-CoA:carnitine CoA-transferase CaiB-like acyl-CoA transferase
MTVTVPHPLSGELKLVGSPMKFSETPVQVRRPPPLLGEHTAEVLAEFGIDDAQRLALKERGVL